MSERLRVLVCTVVHNPTDARVFRREIGALLEAGAAVTAIAPWRSDSPGDERVRRVSVPRATGRNRLPSLLAARARLRELVYEHDALILHDPELLLVVPWSDARRAGTAVVWDVHEDLAAAVMSKAYIPQGLRWVVAAGVRRLEAWAERRCYLLLAERRYQERFTRKHPQVLNLPIVPSSMPANPRKRQAIYVGSITQERGLSLMLELARQLEPHGIAVRLIGETHNPDDTAAIRSTPNLSWEGPLPNAVAMAEAEESLVGLSLLADLPNYHHSMPTKILEYMASGTAVISTPLPLAVEVIGEDGVLLSGFGEESLPEAVGAIVRLADDEAERGRLTKAAYERVSRDFNWTVAGPEFVELIRTAVTRARGGHASSSA